MDAIAIDAYVLDVLMRDLVAHDKQPSAFLVYLYLWRRIAVTTTGAVALSHQMLADATGLSKSAVQAAIRTLRRRKLIRADRRSPTATPMYALVRHWRDRR